MSFQIELEPKDEAAADLISHVGWQLQALLSARQEREKLTQQEIATRLGVDRARVNKCLSGFNNLTLKTLAELVWAMDGEIELTIRLPDSISAKEGDAGDAPPRRAAE